MLAMPEAGRASQQAQHEPPAAGACCDELSAPLAYTGASERAGLTLRLHALRGHAVNVAKGAVRQAAGHRAERIHNLRAR